jgi:Na+/glutamate symporter
VLSLKKKIIESERLKEKNIKHDRFMVLLILISAWFISQDFKDMIMLHSKIFGEPLFVVSVIVSAIVVLTIKHFRDRTLDRLNSELSEIEELERD